MRLVRLVGAGGLALALTLVPLASGVPIVAAAASSVTMVTATTYDVLPDQNRVRVTVEITATSQLHDTVTRHYYSDRAYLAVVPTASQFHLTAATSSPSVKVSSRSDTGTVLQLHFGSQLGAGKSLAMTLTFDIVDPGGAPGRPLRISPSLVAFQAWAYGSDGVAGSRVRVRLPAGYGVAIGRGPLKGPTPESDGHLDFDSGTLATPGTFVADVLADRPGDLVDASQSVVVLGAPVTVLSRSWPDDPAWRKQIGDLLVPGLPALAEAIGLGWPLAPQLEVRESLPQAAGGGAGDSSALDPAASRLDVAYIADATSILHGAAHSWFNGNLVADRWIADGFAALYSERAATAIGAKIESPVMTAEATAHALPLNAWIPGGASDAFAEAAALVAARAIAEQAGDASMRAVWADAARGVGAYQLETVAGTAPGGASTSAALRAVAPEPSSGPLDWRSLLDLLEMHSGGSFEGIFRQWIARTADVALLDARTATRRRYDEVVAAAGTWTLPRSIREAMRAWQFQAANEQLDQAAAVLRQRAQVAAASAAAGLRPPPTLQAAFEGTDGLAAASAEAVTELAVIGSYADAAAARPTNPDFPTRIGLLGVTPEADLAAAAAAFASGDLDLTIHRSAAARATWLATPEVSRRRILGALGIGLASLLVIYLLRTRKRRKMHAHRA